MRRLVLTCSPRCRAGWSRPTTTARRGLVAGVVVRPPSLCARSPGASVRPSSVRPPFLSGCASATVLCATSAHFPNHPSMRAPFIHFHSPTLLTLSLSFSLVRVSCLARLDPDPMARARSTSQSVNRGRPSRRPEQQICDAFPRNNNLHSSCHSGTKSDIQIFTLHNTRGELLHLHSLHQLTKNNVRLTSSEWTILS